MKILIGCPVYKRDWMLPDWFAAIERQTIPLSDLGFVFELGPNDNATHEALWTWQSKHPEVQIFDGVIRETQKHKTHSEGHRTWHHEDYLKMAILRNELLDRVTCLEPERFFSLDSDILLEDPNTLERLFDLTEKHHAVSPLCYMSPNDTRFPNVMTWTTNPGGRARRDVSKYRIGEFFQADIIMAAVMMRPEVYSNVRYAWHRQGEDLGWAANMARNNYMCWSASDIYAPHMMHQWMLDKYKDVGDNRNPTKT